MSRGEKEKESKGKKPKDKTDKEVPAFNKGGRIHAGIPKGKK